MNQIFRAGVCGMIAIMMSALAAPLALAEPVVRLGEVEVTEVDLKAAMASIPSAQRDLFSTSEFSARNLATDLVIRRVLAERARKEGLLDDPIIVARLRLIEERALYELLLDREDRAAVNDEALEALARDEYRAHPERYRVGERVRVRHILISGNQPDGRDAARAQAEALLERLKRGEDFLELARTTSGDPGSASRGGDLGFFGRGKMVKPFEEAAFALEKQGQLSGVVETEFGFHILRFEERRSDGVMAFDEVRDDLMAGSRRKLSAETRERIVGPLRAASGTEIDLEVLRRAIGAKW